MGIPSLASERTGPSGSESMEVRRPSPQPALFRSISGAFLTGSGKLLAAVAPMADDPPRLVLDLVTQPAQEGVLGHDRALSLQTPGVLREPGRRPVGGRGPRHRRACRRRPARPGRRPVGIRS